MANAANTLSDVTAVVATSKDAVLESFNQAFHQVIQLAPKVLAMVAVLVVGYIVARLVGQAIGKLLSEKIGLQVAAERSGLARVDAAHRHRPQRAGDRRHDRLLAADVRVRHGRLQHPRSGEADRRRWQSLVDYIPRCWWPRWSW